MPDRHGDDMHFPLVGQFITLRPFDDLNITPEYIGWLRNPDLMKYSNQRFRLHTTETCKDYLNSFKGTGNLFLAVYRGADFIGTMTAYISENHKTADMGILIGAQSQGKGLGTDAWVTLMRHLLRTGTRKVTAGALRCNSAMIKIMLSSGMNPDGVRIAHEMVNGKPEDILYFAKFNS
jgi:RimJ/RimL family protein N-acetyltransferase